MRKKMLSVGALSVLLMGMLCICYVNDYYHADEAAWISMKSGEDVNVVRVNEGWLFDGPGSGEALIFYPGAKVESESYAPLLRLLAEGGVDCFLVEMPGRFAIFGVNRADSLIEGYSYDKWYLAGHSLGGAAAAIYASEHMDQLAGVIFLGAYPTKNLAGDPFRVLSVFGSEDFVQNRKKAEEGKKYMPKDYTELWIQGGNHAQFGSYGPQKRDGRAAISPQEQWEQTAEAVLAFVAAGR